MASRDKILKYRLKELAELLIRTSSMTERGFVRELKIPWSTYQKDKQTLLTQAFSMPEERLQRYAVAFDVPLSSILNYTVQRRIIIKSNESEGEMAKHFGLT